MSHFAFSALDLLDGMQSTRGVVALVKQPHNEARFAEHMFHQAPAECLLDGTVTSGLPLLLSTTSFV